MHKRQNTPTVMKESYTVARNAHSAMVLDLMAILIVLFAKEPEETTVTERLQWPSATI